MMYERLRLMRDLLHPEGSIWIHCDWRVNSSLRLSLDELFGACNMLNEVVWCYSGGGIPQAGMPKKHRHYPMVFKKSADMDVQSGVQTLFRRHRAARAHGC
jgi:adenine specific DNA methylase Mod